MKLVIVPAVCAFIALPADARLPAPTPEQQAAAAQMKAQEAQNAREQQEALTRVQERIAAKFGSKGGRPGAGPTEQGNLPQKAIESRGSAGPTGGKEQSAEAHSTPAR